MNNNQYNQKEKNAVRYDSLRYSIEMLTKHRDMVSCVNRDYVRNIYNWFKNDDYEPKSKRIVADLDTTYLDLWESLHSSFVGAKKPEELTVCYLSGPNPMNDFRVLVENGIHPNNIWAFEMDKGTYKNALKEIDCSEFPMLKLHKGSIEQFFIHIPKKFDIVYLDFCSAIPSSQASTRVISSLFKNQRLNSPGALITNIASPDVTKDQELEKFSNVIAGYLHPKRNIESSTDTKENEHKTFSSMKKEVIGDFDHYYGQFITRHIFDIASVITPWGRFANSVLWSKYFKETPKKICDSISNDNPLPLIKGLCEINDCDAESQTAKRQLQFHANGLPCESIDAKDALMAINYLKENSQFYNVSLEKILSDYPFEENMYQFCDKPSSNMIFDLLTNQLAYPMHYVTDLTCRYLYKAKDTKMFTDVIFFDECRYIYEWLPTLDLIMNSFQDVSQQLIYRFALDGLVKNRFLYNSEYFFSSSAINIHEDEMFKEKNLKPRIDINQKYEGVKHE